MSTYITLEHSKVQFNNVTMNQHITMKKLCICTKHSVFIQSINNDVSRCEDRTLAEFRLVGDLGHLDFGGSPVVESATVAGGLFRSVLIFAR